MICDFVMCNERRGWGGGRGSDEEERERDNGLWIGSGRGIGDVEGGFKSCA